MAKTVILRTFVRIAQHIVRLSSLFEFLLRIFVVRVPVRMVLHRELTVGLLYVVGRSVFRDTQHLIIISFLCHNYCLIIGLPPLLHGEAPYH